MQMFGFLSSTISKILVALGILMVLSFVVLIALSIVERNRAGAMRYDDEDDEDDLDDFFRETERKDRPYFDDRDEVTDYTQRIQRAGTRRTQKGETGVPPIPLPPPAPQPPQVPVEYDAAPYAAPGPVALAEETYWTPTAQPPQNAAYAAPDYGYRDADAYTRRPA